jgi:hypothetical protein
MTTQNPALFLDISIGSTGEAAMTEERSIKTMPYESICRSIEPGKYCSRSEPVLTRGRKNKDQTIGALFMR